ncbi:MAG: 16S rRNA (cytosine(1402)-N(4))-methyltransferase [Bacteroidetes bacterium]|nr:MAG: 16S rRNA (cytosine(1402)-N(4))-methyltransferase [Bacteroidota bacterium]
MSYHIPVLLSAGVEQLIGPSDGVYVDLTLGGGGHSRALLEALGPGARLFCFDRDAEALANAPDDSRVQVVHANYRDLRQWLSYYGCEHVDGVIADLGVSSHHFDVAERGFSFQQDGPLDMRMGASSVLSAGDVVANYDEGQLADVLYRYGELRESRRLARAIVEGRGASPIVTTGALRAVVEGCLPPRADRHKVLACVFQALRIEVNQELASLESMLGQLPDVVARGGRVVVISYHSLEDRLVKNFLRAGNAEGKVSQDLMGRTDTPFRMLSKGIAKPSKEEIAGNSRARSARMRVAERI